MVQRSQLIEHLEQRKVETSNPNLDPQMRKLKELDDKEIEEKNRSHRYFWPYLYYIQRNWYQEDLHDIMSALYNRMKKEPKDTTSYVFMKDEFIDVEIVLRKERNDVLNRETKYFIGEYSYNEFLEVSPNGEVIILVEFMEQNWYHFHAVKDDKILDQEYFILPADGYYAQMNLLEKGSWDLMKKFNNWVECLVLDPPWCLNGGNPVRGPKTEFNTHKTETLLDIPYQEVLKKGVLCVWCLNSNYDEIVKHFKGLLFDVEGTVDWVKISKKGKLYTSLGYYFSHGKESCIIFSRNLENEEKKRIQQLLPVGIVGKNFGMGQKPKEFYPFFEAIGNMWRKRYKCMELFGRPNNLRARWFTIGEEIKGSSY